MIRTLIIEDESAAAARLEKLLREIDDEIEIVAKLQSVESAINWFSENTAPDLLMLDIQLADGLSFDIFKEIKVECFVIFTTAYDEYAIKAFELNSIDYLLKPINKAKLEQSLRKFRQLSNTTPTIDFDSLIQSIEGKKTNYKKRFAISIGTKIKSVETDAIACFISLKKNTFLCLPDAHQYPIEFSLDRLENLLDPDMFFRINRQALVNYAAIEKISILSKSRLEIQVSGNKEPLLVSTAKAHAFRNWIDK